MRSPGERAAGPAPGRRRSQADKDEQPSPGHDAGRSQPAGESSLFSPGYRDGRPAAARPAGDGQRPGSRYGWAGGAAGKGPVRGFPPAPGQPPPLYPPGQFSAWNRTSGPPEADGQADARMQGDLRQAGRPVSPAASGPGPAGHGGAAYPAEPGHAGPGYPDAPVPGGRGHGPYADAGFEPAYQDLAVSDPAADVTSTQTWGALGDGRETGTWTALRGPDAGHRAAGIGQPPGEAGGQGAAGGYGQPDLDSGRAAQPGRARGHSTGGHSTRARARKRARHPRWPIAAGLAVLTALGAVVFFVVGGRHGTSSAASQDSGGQATSPARPSPSLSPSPTPPAGQWRFITTRADDPSPLTLTELFPASFSAGASYARTVRRHGTDCSSAVVGARLQSAVSRAGCNQVLRASYLSASKKQMGTIGVLNLKTFSGAERAGKAAGPAQFIAPLDGARGPTRDLTKAAGLEEAEVKGHYLILVLADFTSRHAPKTRAQRSALEAFMSQLITDTVNVSLTSRMVTGKP